MNRRKLKISRNAAQPSDLVPLIQRAQYGDDDACSELAAELNTNIALWQGAAELAARSGQAIIDRIAGRGLQLRKALTRHVRSLTHELAESSGSLEERMQVDWVVQCWLLCCEADLIYMEAAAFTRKFAVLALKNMIAADHRFNQALLKLATARAGSRSCPLLRDTEVESQAAAPDHSPVCLTSPPKTPLTATPRVVTKRRLDTQGSLLEELWDDDEVESQGSEGGPDLIQQIEQAWINLISPGYPVLKEALQQGTRMLKQELCGDSPSPLERLMVDRLAIIHLQSFYADASYAQWESTDVRQGAHILRRLNATHRRLLAGLNLLVRLRQMTARAARSAGAKRPARMSAQPPKAAADWPLQSGVPVPQEVPARGPIMSVARTGHHQNCSEEDSGPAAFGGSPTMGIDLAAWNERIWINRIASRVPGHSQFVSQEITATRADLGGPAPSAVERLLVDRLAVNKLQACYAGFVHRQACSLGKKQEKYAQRWLDSARSRGRSAIRELAAVRRMLEPTHKSDKARRSPPRSGQSPGLGLPTLSPRDAVSARRPWRDHRWRMRGALYASGPPGTDRTGIRTVDSERAHAKTASAQTSPRRSPAGWTSQAQLASPMKQRTGHLDLAALPLDFAQVRRIFEPFSPSVVSGLSDTCLEGEADDPRGSSTAGLQGARSTSEPGSRGVRGTRQVEGRGQRGDPSSQERAQARQSHQSGNRQKNDEANPRKEIGCSRTQSGRSGTVRPLGTQGAGELLDRARRESRRAGSDGSWPDS